MLDLSNASILFSLLQLSQTSIEFLLAITLLLHVILILSFLGITWNRNSSNIGALKAGRVVLGLYFVFLVIDATIYIIGIIYGGMPLILSSILILNNPIWFFVIISPPIALMYLDLRLPESSGLYTSLSNWALLLVLWLVVMFFAFGVSSVTILY
ncbi:MAG: hypothetical protein ACFFF9_06755 [Candidatus Thorarchaeota archaeon]